MQRTPSEGAIDAEVTAGVGLPSVDAYIARLPEGWHSYPACQARADMLGSLASAGVLADLEGLPPLGEHVRALATADWIPEVAHVAILLALRDQRFPGVSGEGGFVAWLDKINRDYLPDTSHVGPARALAELPLLWSGLHRGTSAEVVELGRGRAHFYLTHPAAIFPSLVVRWRRRAIEAHLARAGAIQPRATELPRLENQTRVAIRWR